MAIRPSLPSRLHQKRNGIVAEAEPFGQWTQRLGVAIRDHPTGADTEVDWYLVDIIECLPNIEIVSFAIKFTPDNIPPTTSSMLNAL